MDEAQDPQVLAHKIIRLVVNHMVSDDMIVEPQDYAAIRRVFRQRGGGWEQLMAGDQAPFELLKNIVTEWGGMPERRRRSDQLV